MLGTEGKEESLQEGQRDLFDELAREQTDAEKSLHEEEQDQERSAKPSPAGEDDN